MPFDNFRKRSQDTSHRPAERPEQERSSSSSNPFLWPQPSHGQHEQGARAYAETLADAYAGNASDSSTLVGTLGTSSTSSHLQPYYHSLQTALQRGLSMDQAPMHPQAVPPGGMSHRGSTFPGVPRIMPPPGPVYSSVPSFTPKRTYDEVQTSPVSPTTSRFYPQPKRPREGSSQFPDSSAAPSLDEQKWHYANAIKGLNKSVIQEFQQYLIQRNVENRKNRQKSAEKGNVTRGALLDMGGLIEDVDSVKEFLEAPRPDAMLISKVNIAFDRIASYVSDPSKKNSNVNAMREQLQHVRVLQGRETRPDAAVSGGERQTEVNWSNLGLKQKLSGPLEIDALSSTVESLSVHDLPLTQTAGPSYDDILRRNITQSSLQSPGHLSRSDVGGKLAMVKEEVSESDILEVERRREVMEVYDQEDLSRRAHQKMKSAWDVWKKTFRERLPEIQQNYEDPFFQRGKGKQKAKLTYSETNPAVFFAQVVTNDGFVYRSQDGGKSTEHTFTVDDLVHAMNPRFKEFGHAFLQQEWRVTEGQSWASSKKYKPGDSVPPGDQRMDGQHEWLPTAKVPTILHTILQKYPKQEQLAWISALDILRTPTSEVAINFAWNQKINVADVNKHPERYTTSQIGIWEHHSAGMFSPQQQLNKGNGPFHDKINKLIDTFLASNKSQLLELLESLKDFVEENMYGGKLLHNPGLNEDAMKRIKNDLTRQSQKTYSQRAEPYGRLSHTNQMAEVRHESENETIGTILFKEAQNFSELLQSFKETKERTLKIFDQRVAAIRTYSQLDISSFLKGRTRDHTNVGTDELMSQALLTQLQGHTEEAISLWEQVYQKQEQQFGAKSSFTLYSGLTLGSLYRQKGDFQQAQPLLGRMKEIIQAQSIGHKERGDAYRTLAEYYMDFGQSNHALEMLQEGSNAYDKLMTATQRAAPIVENQVLMARIYLKNKQFDEAEAELSRIPDKLKKQLSGEGDEGKTLVLSSAMLQMDIQRQRQVYDGRFEQVKHSTPQTIFWLKSEVLKKKYYGDLDFQQGAYDFHIGNVTKAITKMNAALTNYEHNESMNWREIALVHRTLGENYGKLSRWDEAIASYENALTIYSDRTGSIQHPDQVDVLDQLVTLYRNLGNPDAAKEAFEKYMPEKIARDTVYPLEAAGLYQLSVDFYQSIGRPEKVEQALQNAFVLNRSRLGEGRVETRESCRALLNFYVDKSEYRKAERWVHRLCRMERKQRQGHLRLETIDQAADIYKELGDHATAKAFYQEALAMPVGVTDGSGNRISMRLEKTPLAASYRKKIQVCDMEILSGSTVVSSRGNSTYSWPLSLKREEEE